jgi:hypothetical protein
MWNQSYLISSTKNANSFIIPVFNISFYILSRLLKKVFSP